MTNKETKAVVKYLKEIGYDGLVADGDCGCSFEDNFPCGYNCLINGCCKPAYKHDDGKYYAKKQLPKVTAEQITPEIEKYNEQVAKEDYPEPPKCKWERVNDALYQAECGYGFALKQEDISFIYAWKYCMFCGKVINRYEVVG